jgi:SAM-dependent methyltransferase
VTDWDERYSGEGYYYGTDPNAFLAEVADRIPPGPVLCLGDGEGRNGVYLAGLGHDVTSVDSSAVGLAKAERLAQARRLALSTVHAELEDYVIAEGAWAGIVSIFCHLPSALRARVHAGAVRGLRPGGVFVLEAYTPAQPALGTGGPLDMDLLVSPEALARELAGLDLERCVELRRAVMEGRMHRGDAAVVQCVGVRSG